MGAHGCGSSGRRGRRGQALGPQVCSLGTHTPLWTGLDCWHMLYGCPNGVCHPLHYASGWLPACPTAGLPRCCPCGSGSWCRAHPSWWTASATCRHRWARSKAQCTLLMQRAARYCALGVRKQLTLPGPWPPSLPGLWWGCEARPRCLPDPRTGLCGQTPPLPLPPPPCSCRTATGSSHTSTPIITRGLPASEQPASQLADIRARHVPAQR